MTQPLGKPQIQKPQNWFLVRGLIREKGHWGDFPEKLKAQLQEIAPHAQVHCLEIPGTGEFRDQPTPASMRKIADRVREQFLQTVQASHEDADNYVLSISMGSMISMDWLSRFPEDAKGAVFINTSLRGYSPLYKRLRPTAYPFVLKALIEHDPAKRERMILGLTSNQMGEDPRTQENWIEIQKQRPVTKANALRQLAAAAKFRAPRNAALPPLLILTSDKDRLVSSDCSRQINKNVKNSILKTHPTAGHDLPLDDPQWVVQSIRDWMQREKV